MLNKPKFMKPSTNKEECTIDLTPGNEIPFSCIVDGNEAVTSWQIIIYDILNDDIVFDTGEITSEPPFYPVDEKNRNVVFTRNLNAYTNKAGKSLTNREDAYYWTITFWGSSGNSVTSYQEVFYANKTPSIKFLYNGNIVDLRKETINELNSKDCTFKAELDFGDRENEYKAQLKRYGWRIIDSSNGQVLVDTITKNQIYGSVDNIVCSYDGFLNGSSYSIELYVETQNNTKITSSFEISVSYNTAFLSNDFNVEILTNEPAIMLDWMKAHIISGILKDSNNNVVDIKNTEFKVNYPVKSQCSIVIPDKFKIEYERESSLNFATDENAYIAFSTRLLSKSNNVLLHIEGNDDFGNAVSRKLTYIARNGEFEYEVVGREGVSKSVKRTVKHRPSDYVWYNILMSPLIDDGNDGYTIDLNVFENKVVGCIYPSQSLYPRVGFYPIFGNWVRGE